MSAHTPWCGSITVRDVCTSSISCAIPTGSGGSTKCEREAMKEMERKIMTTARKFFVTCILAAMALPLYAYNDTVTHPQLTIFAAHKSVLYTDGSILFSLGLEPASTQLFNYRARLGPVTLGTAP